MPDEREPLIVDRTSEQLVSFPHANASAPMVATVGTNLSPGLRAAMEKSWRENEAAYRWLAERD